MKINYDPETDSLYIDLSAKPGVESEAVSDDSVVNCDENGEPVGIDIQNAGNTVDLVAETGDFDGDTLADLDAAGKLVAITIENASQRADVRRLTLHGINETAGRVGHGLQASGAERQTL